MAEFDPQTLAQAQAFLDQASVFPNPLAYYEQSLSLLPPNVQQAVHDMQKARRPVREMESPEVREAEDILMRSGPIDYDLVKQNALSAFPALNPNAPVPAKEIIDPNDPQRRAAPEDYH